MPGTPSHGLIEFFGLKFPGAIRVVKRQVKESRDLFGKIAGRLPVARLGTTLRPWFPGTSIVSISMVSGKAQPPAPWARAWRRRLCLATVGPDLRPASSRMFCSGRGPCPMPRCSPFTVPEHPQRRRETCRPCCSPPRDAGPPRCPRATYDVDRRVVPERFQCQECSAAPSLWPCDRILQMTYPDMTTRFASAGWVPFPGRAKIARDAGHDSQDDARRGRTVRRPGDDGPDPE